jgi:hypothetical protein
MENYYYVCVYERLQQAVPNADTRTVLQKRKAKIVQINITHLQLIADNNACGEDRGRTNNCIQRIANAKEEERANYYCTAGPGK